MLSRPQTWGRLFAGVAGGLLLGAILLGIPNELDVRELSELDPALSVVVAGRLEYLPTGKHVQVLNADGVALDCIYDYCGFSGLSNFYGKEVEVRMTAGRLIQVSSGLEVVDGRSIKLADCVFMRRYLAGMILLGVFAGVVAYRKRGQPIRARSEEGRIGG